MLTLSLLICVFIFVYPRETGSLLIVHYGFPSQHAKTKRVKYSNVNWASIKTLAQALVDHLRREDRMKEDCQREQMPAANPYFLDMSRTITHVNS